MLVVPVRKDTIQTLDGTHYRVVEYTNYKDGGPAVYARPQDSKTVVLVYFMDISHINGTRVDFKPGSRIFSALGHIAREQPLPQPGDRITFAFNDFETNEPQEKTLRVQELKLKSRMLGINKGMFVKDSEGEFHRLKFVTDIKRELGGSNFDRSAFLSYYKDYIGV